MGPANPLLRQQPQEAGLDVAEAAAAVGMGQRADMVPVAEVEVLRAVEVALVEVVTVKVMVTVAVVLVTASVAGDQAEVVLVMASLLVGLALVDPWRPFCPW